MEVILSDEIKMSAGLSQKTGSYTSVMAGRAPNLWKEMEMNQSILDVDPKITHSKSDSNHVTHVEHQKQSG